MEYILLSQDSDQGWAISNTEMDIRVIYKAENFYTSLTIKSLLHGFKFKKLLKTEATILFYER